MKPHSRFHIAIAIVAAAGLCGWTLTVCGDDGMSTGPSTDTGGPPNAPKNASYISEDVVFDGATPDVKLAGTLTRPRGKEPVAVIYLIPGAMPADRDETMFGHKPFKVLADFLTCRGFAVLRVDDRGVGKSTGQKMLTGMDDLAGDVLAGLRYLKTHEHCRRTRIGLIGHSQGAVIAAIAASRSDDVAFVVMMAGTGMPGAETLALHLAQQGQGDTQLNLKLVSEVLPTLAGNDDAETTVRACQQRWKKLMAEWPSEQKQSAAEFSEIMKGILSEFLAQPMMREVLVYDPKPILRKLHCPVLALCGGHDPTSVNLPAIAEGLEASACGDYGIAKLPGLNHLMQASEAADLSDAASIKESISPVALEAIADWIAPRCKTP